MVTEWVVSFSLFKLLLPTYVEIKTSMLVPQDNGCTSNNCVTLDSCTLVAGHELSTKNHILSSLILESP